MEMKKLYELSDEQQELVIRSVKKVSKDLVPVIIEYRIFERKEIK
jgi:hypothetical protein